MSIFIIAYPLRGNSPKCEVGQQGGSSNKVEHQEKDDQIHPDSLAQATDVPRHSTHVEKKFDNRSDF